jgi:hypothetical protein
MPEPTIRDRVQHLSLAECVRDMAQTMRELADVVTLLADRVEAIEAKAAERDA